MSLLHRHPQHTEPPPDAPPDLTPEQARAAMRENRDLVERRIMRPILEEFVKMEAGLAMATSRTRDELSLAVVTYPVWAIGELLDRYGLQPPGPTRDAAGAAARDAAQRIAEARLDEIPQNEIDLVTMMTFFVPTDAQGGVRNVLKEMVVAALDAYLAALEPVPVG